MTGERDLVLRAIERLLPPQKRVLIDRKGERTWRVRIAKPAAVYFVKLYRAGSSGFEREIQALQRLSQIGTHFPVPTIVGHGLLRGVGRTFLMMTELQGCTLEELAINQGLPRKQVLFLIGRLLSTLHESITVREAENTLDPMQAVFSTCDNHMRLLTERGQGTVAELSRETRRCIEQKASTLRRRVFCHGDLHPKNVIVQSGPDRRIVVGGIVDLESARIAWPEFDIAKSIVVCATADGTDEDALLAGYGCRQLGDEALKGFKAFHAIDGWLYGGLLQKRDQALWDNRLRLFAAPLSSNQWSAEKHASEPHW